MVKRESLEAWDWYETTGVKMFWQCRGQWTIDVRRPSQIIGFPCPNNSLCRGESLVWNYMRQTIYIYIYMYLYIYMQTPDLSPYLEAFPPLLTTINNKATISREMFNPAKNCISWTLDDGPKQTWHWHITFLLHAECEKLFFPNIFQKKLRGIVHPKI